MRQIYQQMLMRIFKQFKNINTLKYNNDNNKNIQHVK